MRRAGVRWWALALAAVAAARAQHGVIREYAALAPKPDAVALAPLFNTPLADTSITRGPDGAFYLTGTPLANGKATPSARLELWRSADMKEWSSMRALDLAPGRYVSPEIHRLKGAFWLAAAREGGGTDLWRFEGDDLKTATRKRVQITAEGSDPSLFLDDDGTFYWVLDRGRIARMKPDPMEGLAAEPAAATLRVAGPPAQQRGQQVERPRGAHHSEHRLLS